MSSPNPEIEARKQQWHERHRLLENQLSEPALLQKLQETRRKVRVELADELFKVREAGYRFAGDLEGQLHALARRADDAERVLVEQVRQGVGDLRWKVDQLRDSFRRLDIQSFGDPSFALSRLDCDLDDVTRDLERLKRRIEQELDDLPEKSEGLGRRLATLRQYIDRARNASFSFSPDESLYLAVECEWKKTGKKSEDPDGVLHVTDRRILMERKEKEGGFLGFGGTPVQGLLWELPWSQVEGIRSEKKGLLGGVDLIHFRLKPGSPLGVEELTVEVKGGIDAHEFADQLRPALEGTLERQRAGGM